MVNNFDKQGAHRACLSELLSETDRVYPPRVTHRMPRQFHVRWDLLRQSSVMTEVITLTLQVQRNALEPHVTTTRKTPSQIRSRLLKVTASHLRLKTLLRVLRMARMTLQSQFSRRRMTPTKVTRIKTKLSTRINSSTPWPI